MLTCPTPSGECCWNCAAALVSGPCSPSADLAPVLSARHSSPVMTMPFSTLTYSSTVYGRVRKIHRKLDHTDLVILLPEPDESVSGPVVINGDQ